MDTERRHFSHFEIAGFTYYDGPLVFKDLQIGSKLHLVYEPDNKFEPYAVAIYYNGHKLGYVPRSENKPISKFLEMGYEIFETVIQRLDPTSHPELQVGVVTYFVRHKPKSKGSAGT